MKRRIFQGFFIELIYGTVFMQRFGLLTLKIDQMKAKEINKGSLDFVHYVHYVCLYMCIKSKRV